VSQISVIRICNLFPIRLRRSSIVHRPSSLVYRASTRTVRLFAVRYLQPRAQNVLFMQSKPNFCRFCVKNDDCEEKQTQPNPIKPNFRPSHAHAAYQKRARAQKTLFMQNEPNSRRFCVKNTDLGEKRTQNEPKTNPKRTQNEPKRTQNEAKLKKAKMNVNKVLTKEYEKKLNWALYENEPNSNPKQTQSKPISPSLKGVKQQYFLTEFTNHSMMGMIAGVNADVAQW
jgi:hypothetical protein